MLINQLRLCHIIELVWVFLLFMTIVVSLVVQDLGINSLDGLPDPESEDPEDMDTLVSEPPIGPYRVYYRIGFPDKPILYPGSGDASEGDTIDVLSGQLTIGTLYQTLPSCDDTALNAGNFQLETQLNLILLLNPSGIRSPLVNEIKERSMMNLILEFGYIDTIWNI